MVTDQGQHAASSPRNPPLLILVSGAPATGKTTLARRLAEALSLPLLARDTISQILGDAFAVQTWEESRALVRPTFAIYYALLDEYLRAGISLVTETNFYRGLSETELRSRIEKSRAILIHCRTAREVSVQRFIARVERGERPAVFLPGDRGRIEQLRAGELVEAWERAEQPVDLDVPTLCVDTTHGYSPSFAAVLSFVELHRSASEHSGLRREI